MTDDTDAARRRALRTGVALLVGLSASRLARAASLAPTPAQPLGPFYPRVLPDDRDNDLATIRGRDRPALGTVLFVEGRVLDASATAVADALVEIWQCDVHGKYLRPGDDSPGPRDENFQGYGQARTDATGAYSFRTIRPVPYSSRPPHIHFQVRHPRYPTLVTQLYAQAAGGDGMAGATAGRWPETANPSLWVTFTPASREAGALAARFDIVLAGAASTRQVFDRCVSDGCAVTGSG
jgi:protocatechuate 3,4-dioxygenase beta subunit